MDAVWVGACLQVIPMPVPLCVRQETGMADVCAVALAEAVTHSQTLRLIRFDESELPLQVHLTAPRCLAVRCVAVPTLWVHTQVLRGAEPQAILELRTPDPDAVKKDRGGHTRRDSFTSNVSDSRSHRSLVCACTYCCRGCD